MRSIVLAFLLTAGVGWAQVTERLSVATGGAQGVYGGELPGHSGNPISSDGRFVVFTSLSDFFPGDMNGWDVFVRDRALGTTELIGVSSTGIPENGESGLFGLTISRDGRYVVFDSRATNLVPGDTNGRGDIFLRDRRSAITERVSISTTGLQGDGDSWYPSISDDGRFVAFTSMATNLVTGDTNSADDTFVRDRLTGITERVSVSTGGVQGNADSSIPSISADGRFVAFYSQASDLVPGDTNGHLDVFVRDRQLGTTTRVSVATGGAEGNQDSADPVISADGRFVAFVSLATNLVPGDTNGCFDVFVHDRRSGSTSLVSVATGGTHGNSQSNSPWISAGGRYVAFASASSNLVPACMGGLNVYVRDCVNGTTELCNVRTGSSQGLHPGLSDLPSITDDGRFVVFRGYQRDLVSGDSNGSGDVFLHDRAAAGITTLCDPGFHGVVGCPCSNPPAGPGNGCDNSSGNGGASISAAGVAYLSMDSLAFTTSGELSSTLSILMQGNELLAHGVVYGQGVRCVGGTLERLFTKTSVAGCIRAPDFGAGDPTVSARSAARGDVIQGGQSRWYLVYYRDPTVLGGCPASSTFNATQTGQVTWWP